MLRYTEALSGERANARQRRVLADHLTMARDDARPVRLVIFTPATEVTPGSYGIRPDLVGKVTSFDGDGFTVDFTRIARPDPTPKQRPRRRR